MTVHEEQNKMDMVLAELKGSADMAGSAGSGSLPAAT